MANEITTTIVVDFGDVSGAGDDGHLSAEVDGRVDGLNEGKTSFSPGDTVYILAFLKDNTSIIETLVSIGAIFPGPNQQVIIEENITFAKEKEATLSKPYLANSLSVQWIGNNLGGLTVGDDQFTITAASLGVGIAKVTYKTLAKSYAISSPLEVNGDKDFSILVYLKGQVS